MDKITLTIDDVEINTPEGVTLLKAAQDAGIYIPRLCVHPNLPSSLVVKTDEFSFRGSERIEGDNSVKEFKGCQLCVVEIEGVSGFPLACITPATQGMVVHSDTPQLREFRQDKLMLILANHPHACLLCPQREGCSRDTCSQNVAVEARCCIKLGNCELQRVAEYIGIKPETPRYIFRNRPIIKTQPMFNINYNLCIDGCLRCVRVCQEVRGVNALGFTFRDGAAVAGTKAATFKESGCKFCGACIEVCPTGALMYQDATVAKRLAARLNYSSPLLPPKEEAWLEFNSDNVGSVPEVAGVYQLLNEQKAVIYIAGALNLRQGLEQNLGMTEPPLSKARYFLYEENPMYTVKESELIQQFAQQHGQMPEGNQELLDLF